MRGREARAVMGETVRVKGGAEAEVARGDEGKEGDRVATEVREAGEEKGEAEAERGS